MALGWSGLFEQADMRKPSLPAAAVLGEKVLENEPSTQLRKIMTFIMMDDQSVINSVTALPLLFFLWILITFILIERFHSDVFPDVGVERVEKVHK